MRLCTLIRAAGERPAEFSGRIAAVCEIYHPQFELVYRFVPYSPQEEIWLLFNVRETVWKAN